MKLVAAWEDTGAEDTQPEGQTPDSGQSDNGATSQKRVPRIRFYAPSELRDYQPDNGIVLVGDCHVMRGEVFLIGGEPGVGKSRAATSLGVAGATPGAFWFGLPVLRQFRTMIIQTENGRFRLRQEFSALNCDGLEDWIRVSPDISSYVGFAVS